MAKVGTSSRDVSYRCTPFLSFLDDQCYQGPVRPRCSCVPVRNPPANLLRVLPLSQEEGMYANPSSHS